MSNDEVILKVDHLCQYFGFNKAVDDVSFTIKKGEVFGLVGESGCGKTTTGRSIIKLYNITGGDIYFKDIRIGAGVSKHREAIAEKTKEYKANLAAIDPQAADAKVQKDTLTAQYRAFVAQEKKAIAAAKYDQTHCDKVYQKNQAVAVRAKYQALLDRADPAEIAGLKKEYADQLRKAKRTKLVTQIQMIFQDPIASLDPRMTIREIIAEGLIIQGERDKNVIDEKVFEMLEKVGLVREHASRYPHEFSGGQRQRIGVARAVVMQPDLIIADEPVSALDVSIQAQVINLLNDLRHEMGLTLLFIAHDLSVVKYFSDRIGVMYFGKMVELASSDELFRHPLHPYTRSLLSAIPMPDPLYEKERQRISYNPLTAHDYSAEGPTMREVEPGHFVYCNTAEFERYKAELSNDM